MTTRSDVSKAALRLALAEVLGEDAEAITAPYWTVRYSATNPRWVQVMHEGVLVRLYIGRWRDLGIDPRRGDEEEVPHDLLELGHELLFLQEDVRTLDGIDSSARKWLEKNAFCTHWSFFVPVTAYSDWKARNEELLRQYLDIRDRLADENVAGDDTGSCHCNGPDDVVASLPFPREGGEGNEHPKTTR